jgi:hypothetical protein
VIGFLGDREMRKFLPALLVVIGSLFTGGSLFAGEWQPPTRVSNILVEGEDTGERIYVMFEENANPDLCPDESGWMRVYGNTRKGKYIYSNLLTAKTTNRTVRVNFYQCDDWGRPIVYGVALQ